MSQIKRKEIYIECHCGLEVLRLTVYTDEPEFTYIELLESKFSTGQDTVLVIVKRYLRRLWSAIAGKEYFLWEVIMTKDDAKRLLEYLGELQEKEVEHE